MEHWGKTDTGENATPPASDPELKTMPVVLRNIKKSLQAWKRLIQGQGRSKIRDYNRSRGGPEVLSSIFTSRTGILESQPKHWNVSCAIFSNL